MALKPWTAFYPDVLLSLPGCPAAMVDHYLRRAVIELCLRSKRLKIDMPAFSTVAGVPTYPLSPGLGMATITILDGMVNGLPIEAERRAEVSRVIDWPTEQGQPTKCLKDGDDETVRLWKTPDGVYSVTLTLAIKPDLSATGIEAWFADRYREAIISGGLAGLLILPKQAWSDPGLSGYHNSKFEDGIRKATADAEKDDVRAPLRTRLHGRA